MKRLLILFFCVLLLSLWLTACNGQADDVSPDSDKTVNKTDDKTLGTIQPTGVHPGNMVFRYVFVGGKLYTTCLGYEYNRSQAEKDITSKEDSKEAMIQFAKEHALREIGIISESLDSPSAEYPNKDGSANGFAKGDVIYKLEDSANIFVLTESSVSWYNKWPDKDKTYNLVLLIPYDKAIHGDLAQ